MGLTAWNVLLWSLPLQIYAIRFLTKGPNPGWGWSSLAALVTTLSSYGITHALQPWIMDHWFMSLPFHPNLGILEPIIAWFCASSLASAVEIFLIHRIFKIQMSLLLGLFIFTKNAFCNVLEVQAILQKP